MSRKLLLLTLTLPLLMSCATAAGNAQQFTGVPLLDWPKADQEKAANLIALRCGLPPHCPADAVLEQATLDRIKERNLVRAAGKAP